LLLFSDDTSFLGRLVCVYDWILVGGGDFRVESLLDWMDPSLSLVVCPLASASSIPLVELSLLHHHVSLPLAPSPYFVVLLIVSVGPLSDGRPVPSLFSLVPLLAL
jgi:hypothetical protein